MTESHECNHTGNEKTTDNDSVIVKSDSGADIDYGVTEDVYESDAEVLQLLRIIREETKDLQRSDAFAALLERYRPLTARLVTQYAQSPLSVFDRQELEEEACIALYHAARLYRAGTHATFGYFARVCIRNRLISFLRKQKHEEFCIPIDEPDENDSREMRARHTGALTVGDIGEQVVQKDAFRALFDRFLASLTEYERRVFHLYVKGSTYKEIAEALDVSLKSVDNAVYRIRVKLKQQLQAQ